MNIEKAKSKIVTQLWVSRVFIYKETWKEQKVFKKTVLKSKYQNKVKRI